MRQPLGMWVYISRHYFNIATERSECISIITIFNSHWAYKFILNVAVLLLPLTVCVRTLTVAVLS